MGNRNTTHFQNLKELPTPLSHSQCVLHKHELLICGGVPQRICYSYHTIKNEYKFICEYPRNVQLYGHCVVKLVDNNKDRSQITLLSFGSDWNRYSKHTLIMKYVSVWSDDNNNRNHPIIIGRDNDDYIGARALIGGINNHLLFITYLPKNISVFDLKTFQFIKHDTLPTNCIQYHCFVSKSENGQVQEMIKTNQKNKQNYQMLLFCEKTGLSIKYNEDNNAFQFQKLPVCDDIAPFYEYAYVCINDFILFFGGSNYPDVSKSVYKYSIRENKWMTFQDTLPSPLRDCVAILSEKDNDIHIIGGVNDKDIKVSSHMKTKVRAWDPSQL
ncbi:hypothetical protein RFI_31620, partial [Reticulomyxa filosa]